VMAVLSSSAGVDLKTLSQHIENDVNQTLPRYLTAGGEAVDGALRTYMQEALTLVLQLLPSLIIISTAAGALANYSAVRLIWRRMGERALFPGMMLTQWKAPEACVWALIAAGLGCLLPPPGLRVVGLNVLLLVGLVYLIQGLGIMIFYLNKTSVPPMFRSIAYLFLAIQPLLLLGVAVFGLFDLWFDFRRIGNKREEAQ
jgi:uncharacterized protein YybS (DUF2232 family)